MTNGTIGEREPNHGVFETITGSPTFIPVEVPSLYANNTQFQVSPWDISLDFGQVKGRGEQGNLVIQPLVRVLMSPSHAKALLNLLSINLHAYEAEFGPIPIPPEFSSAEQATS